MIYLTIATKYIDLKSLEFGANYFILVGGGLLAGFGIAVFPMIINTLFWFSKRKAGTSQAIYGGIGNTFPGIFALIMPIILSNWNL